MLQDNYIIGKKCYGSHFIHIKSKRVELLLNGASRGPNWQLQINAHYRNTVKQ